MPVIRQAIRIVSPVSVSSQTTSKLELICEDARVKEVEVAILTCIEKPEANADSSLNPGSLPTFEYFHPRANCHGGYAGPIGKSTSRRKPIRKPREET
jgi:hypothetical protein